MEATITTVALPNLIITCLSLSFFIFQQHSTQLTTSKTFSYLDFSPIIFLGLFLFCLVFSFRFGLSFLNFIAAFFYFSWTSTWWRALVFSSKPLSLPQVIFFSRKSQEPWLSMISIQSKFWFSITEVCKLISKRTIWFSPLGGKYLS